MKLIQRIGYYLGGFSIGLIILAFFLNGKKTSCSYGPEARVLKNIKSKKISYNHDVYAQLASSNIDTTDISNILKNADIDFSKSLPRQKPCGAYYLESVYDDVDVSMIIENCDSIATITNFNSSR
jgi:hypothetical protein